MLYNIGDCVENYKSGFIGYLFLKFNSLNERNMITANISNLVNVVVA